MDARTILENVRAVSARFATERSERQQRRALDAADFAQLREAGFPLTGVPVDQGGIWQSVRQSTRPLCELLRTLAHGDSSVALVCAMYPTVLVFWLANTQAPAPFQAAWEAQRRRMFQTVREGPGGAPSPPEPGSGGDLAKIQAIARRGPTDGSYRLTGQKAFGSGSGITSYMFTTAIPEGETAPDVFFLDMRNVAWDGMAGGDPNGSMGWPRHGGNPEPCAAVYGLPSDTHCLARACAAAYGRGRRPQSVPVYSRHCGHCRNRAGGGTPAGGAAA